MILRIWHHWVWNKSTSLMIMLGKKSSEVVLWKLMHLASFTDTICAGRREKSFNCLGILFYESNLYSVNWYTYLQKCLSCNVFFQIDTSIILPSFEFQLYQKTLKNIKTLSVLSLDHVFKGNGCWEHHLSLVPDESKT